PKPIPISAILGCYVSYNNQASGLLGLYEDMEEAKSKINELLNNNVDGY
ncbi:MAG: hypothetical protein FD122_3826, partial [Stygiobacter sp.]